MIERPVLRLTRSIGEMLLDGVALGLFGFLCITFITNWSNVPDSAPVHFGLAGKADAMGSKWVLLILPVFACCFFIAFFFIRRIPHRFNYLWPITERNAESQYRNARLMMAWIGAEIVCTFSFLGWSSIQAALGISEGVSPFFLPVMFAGLIGTVGFFLFRAYKLR